MLAAKRQDLPFPVIQSGLNRTWVTQFLGPTALGWGSCCTGTPAEGMHMGEGLCLPLLQASSWGRSGGSGLLRHAQEGLNLCPHVQNPRRQKSL